MKNVAWHQAFLHFLGIFMLLTNLLQSLGTSPTVSAPLSLPLALLGAFFLNRKRPAYHYQLDLVVLTLALGLLIQLWQCGEFDDDFWLHSPVQSLLEYCGNPPDNPYFPGLKLRGHYGRDLVISGLAYTSGMHPLFLQIWLTSLVHASLFLVLTDWLRSAGFPAASQRLGALCIFFGVCVGGRPGLLDCYQNNNSFAFGFAMLALSQAQDYLSQGGRRSWARMLAALTYAGVCYEMLWGLVVAGLVLVWPRRQVFVAIGLSAGLTLACSGSLSQLIHKPPPSTRKVSFGEATQSQKLALHFPKSDLFQVYMTPTHSSVVSLGFQLWPASIRRAVESIEFSPERRVALYSPAYLRQHWFGTWLAPLVLVWAVRHRRSWGRPLLQIMAIGAVSFWTPGLIDFGPVYEHENYRWSFTSGAFFSLALGVATGLAWHHLRRGRVAMLVVVFLTCQWGLYIYGEKIRVTFLDPGRRLQSALSTRRYLENQPGFEFTPGTYQACQWLAEHVPPGQTLLSDHSLAAKPDMLAEAAFLCCSRMVAAGHAFPIEQDPVGTQPYRTQPWYRAFWAQPCREMVPEGIDWVARVRPTSPTLEGVPGFHKEAEFEGIALYRVEPAAPSQPSGSARLLAPPPPQAELGSTLWLDLEGPGPLAGRVLWTPLGEGDPESYAWALPAQVRRLPLAVPSRPGAYRGEVTAANGSFQIEVVLPKK